jgi:hypothetical protein
VTLFVVRENGRLNLTPAKAGGGMFVDAFRWWRPDKSGLTPGYYLSRLRRETYPVARLRALTPPLPKGEVQKRRWY